MSVTDFKHRIERDRDNYNRTCDLACEKLDDLERAGIPPDFTLPGDGDWEFLWNSPGAFNFTYSVRGDYVRGSRLSGGYGCVQRDGSFGKDKPGLDWEETVRALQLALKREQT